MELDPSVAAALASALDARFAGNVSCLQELVAIPSVSGDAGDHDALWRAAELVRAQLEATGLDTAELVTAGGPPAVLAASRAVPGRPTVLLYAHYDVQPADRGAWSSDPYDPVVRDGRLYGRGTADDKAGVVVHVAAIEAWLTAAGSLPVQVKVLIDGEEECGSRHLPALLARHREELGCDVIVVPDSVNLQPGEPALTTSLRGVVSVDIEVRSLERPVHSGIWGGAVLDPVSAMCGLIAALVDQRGEVRVDGFEAQRPEDDAILRAEVDADTLAELVGVAPGAAVRRLPERTLADQLWEEAAATVIGMDVPGVHGAANAIQPSCRARLSIRIPPDAHPGRCLDALYAAIHDHAPAGLAVDVSPVSLQHGWRARTDTPTFRAAAASLTAAFGAGCRTVGLGATIPFVHQLGDALGRPEVLLTAVGDARSNPHGPDESVALDDVRRAALAETLLLGMLGNEPPDGPQPRSHRVHSP